MQTRQASPAAGLVIGIDDHGSHVAFDTERRVAGLLGGGCRLPLGAYAEWRDGRIRLLAVVVRPDGSDLVWSQVEATSPSDAAGEAAEILRSGGADRILQEVR